MRFSESETAHTSPGPFAARGGSICDGLVFRPEQSFPAARKLLFLRPVRLPVLREKRRATLIGTERARIVLDGVANRAKKLSAPVARLIRADAVLLPERVLLFGAELH